MNSNGIQRVINLQPHQMMFSAMLGSTQGAKLKSSWPCGLMVCMLWMRLGQPPHGSAQLPFSQVLGSDTAQAKAEGLTFKRTTSFEAPTYRQPATIPTTIPPCRHQTPTLSTTTKPQVLVSSSQAFTPCIACSHRPKHAKLNTVGRGEGEQNLCYVRLAPAKTEPRGKQSTNQRDSAN